MQYRKYRSHPPYDPASKEPFLISRSKLELFIHCPRCFYLDRRMGLTIPDNSSYSINQAIDRILKREFDHYRQLGLKHPIMQKYDIDALPFYHKENMKEWRRVQTGGIKFHHAATNLIIKGAVDELWLTSKNEMIVVDYKASASTKKTISTGKWLKSSLRQLEVYAWLLQMNQYKTHDTGYLLYCNADVAQKELNDSLHFDVSLIAHRIDTTWIEDIILKAHECLNASALPAVTEKCQMCTFLQLIKKQGAIFC